ncbi:hypothetical protein [Brevibacterium sp. p3-SID960]|uniref:hypothetical protein n=1 Tax=Brevibacterium sp. p3-SID960 TaxID=2916063 RepID=UPI0037BE64CE
MRPPTAGSPRPAQPTTGSPAIPLHTFEGIDLHFQGLKHVSNRGPVKQRWTELCLITVRFCLLLTAVYALLPIGMALAFFGVQLAVFGVCMDASFVRLPAHEPAGPQLSLLRRNKAP